MEGNVVDLKSTKLQRYLLSHVIAHALVKGFNDRQLVKRERKRRDENNVFSYN